MEPFELIDPIEETVDAEEGQSKDIQYIAPAQPENSEKPTEEKATEESSQPSDHSDDKQEQTLFGW
jgi:hypothetical protein